MNARLFFFLLASPVLWSCGNDELMQDSANEPNSVISVNPKIEAIKNYISSTHKMSRAGGYSLIPHIVNGDTVMYIANYGQGWEVFSNDCSIPMVLMKSDEGSFYPSEIEHSTPFLSFFNDLTEQLYQQQNQITETSIDSEWTKYGISTLWDGEGERPEEQYRYTLVGTADEVHTTETFTPKGGRLETKWSQDEFYNMYTPYCIDNPSYHSLVGCVAVAVGQFLRHSNKYYGTPESTVTTASFDHSSNSYNFSGSSSTIWNEFTTSNIWAGVPSYMESTAVFLGYVAKSVGISFGLLYNDGGSTRKGSAGSLFSNSCINFFKSQTGLTIKQASLTGDNIESILNTGRPVLAQNFQHAFIIDSYTKYTSLVTEYYAMVKVNDNQDEDTDQEDNPDLSDNLSLEELRAKYGEIYIEHHSDIRGFYNMNWGWGGLYDNIQINSLLSIWTLSSSVTLNGGFSICYFY